jgi:hypothetical protein
MFNRTSTVFRYVILDRITGQFSRVSPEPRFIDECASVSVFSATPEWLTKKIIIPVFLRLLTVQSDPLLRVEQLVEHGTLLVTDLGHQATSWSLVYPFLA